MSTQHLVWLLELVFAIKMAVLVVFPTGTKEFTIVLSVHKFSGNTPLDSQENYYVLTFSRPEFDSTRKRCVDNKLFSLWIIMKRSVPDSTVKEHTHYSKASFCLWTDFYCIYQTYIWRIHYTANICTIMQCTKCSTSVVGYILTDLMAFEPYLKYWMHNRWVHPFWRQKSECILNSTIGHWIF